MDRKQFYRKLYYSAATKNIKQIMMMIIKLKIVIMIILMMKMIYQFDIIFPKALGNLKIVYMYSKG